MLITYNTYVNIKTSLINTYGTYKSYPNISNYLNVLIKKNVIDKSFKATAREKIQSDLFFDYVIFLHYYNKNNISFQNENGCRFKLDTTHNRKLLWKHFKKEMNL